MHMYKFMARMRRHCFNHGVCAVSFEMTYYGHVLATSHRVRMSYNTICKTMRYYSVI